MGQSETLQSMCKDFDLRQLGGHTFSHRAHLILRAFRQPRQDLRRLHRSLIDDDISTSRARLQLPPGSPHHHPHGRRDQPHNQRAGARQAQVAVRAASVSKIVREEERGHRRRFEWFRKAGTECCLMNPFGAVAQ